MKTYSIKLEAEITEHTASLSERCVQFLLDEKALKPYHDSVEKKRQVLETLSKVVEVRKLEEEVNQVAADLELLIDIVSNLEIEDTSHSTRIIDNISLIFATINQLKAALRNKKKALGSEEARADFAAQLKLIDQSIINYLDIAGTPEKCDEFQTKISIQLEELEGKFTDFEEFIGSIIEKREEVHAAFEAKKNALVEKRNKKALALQNASERILKGAQSKAKSFSTAAEIQGYFASDLMINKVRDIIQQLKELDDTGKAEEIETSLKSARENALRKLKDKQDLYEDGDNVIRLGKHKFGVNKQPLDLSIVFKNGIPYYHLTGTDFYQELRDSIFLDSKELWDREFVSESPQVYRSSYLAYKLFKKLPHEELLKSGEEELLKIVQQESSSDYSEGYIKGVHDVDAGKILKVLVHKHHELGILRYPPKIRACAQFFWNSLSEKEKEDLDRGLKASGEVLSIFPDSREYDFIIRDLSEKAQIFAAKSGLFDSEVSEDIAAYLFEELQGDDEFESSQIALGIKEDFFKALKEQQADLRFKKSLESIKGYVDQISLVRQWVSAFVNNRSKTAAQPQPLRAYQLR